ncbi:nucleoside kinase [Paenibacillus sp. IB182493]|uniref:Nucleoside kinase n=2 Tax=Paenibacillus arenilitoris TaxID=2772299 RepID=A0A927H6M8_9BACL|nr:nucleoside kinase [Paenibacillus arenilitoris]
MGELRERLPDFIVLSTDNDMFGTTSELLDYPNRFNVLFQFAHFAAKSGKGTVICGTVMPWDAQKCDAYDLFDEVCFINLHCDDDTRNNRLRNREDKATWTDEMLKRHEEFARWLLDNAETAYRPPMPTIDTAVAPPAEVAGQISEYVLKVWNQ